MNPSRNSFPSIKVKWLAAALALAWTAAAGAPLHAQGDAQISDTTRRQIDAIRQARDARTPAQKKLDTQLFYASRQATSGVAVVGAPQLRANVTAESDGRVKVRILATVSPELLGEIETLGGTVLGSHPADRVVFALLPLRNLETLAGRADVRFIGLPPRAHLRGGARRELATDALNPRPQETDTPNNDPEGDATHGAKTVRTQYGVNGAGIKVGVISDSLDDNSGSYQTALNAGYVSPVTVIPGQRGTGEAEGLAMLEIVHRIAPGAQLYFATGFIDEPTMAQSIKAMAADGCKVIIDDIGYADENPFQDETIALAVDAVTAQGVLFFSAGGNSGNFDSGMGSCWEGDFVSTNGDGFLDFAAGSGNPAREKNLVTSSVTVGDIDLFWSEPDNNVTSEYDLYEFGPGGAAKQTANNDPTMTGVPFQSLSNVVPGDSVAVQRATGVPRFLHLDTSGDNGTFAVATAGHTRGHNAMDAPGSFCVAATPASTSQDNTPNGPFPNLFNSSNSVEDYSDDGLRRMFFKPDGTAFTPGNFSSTGGQVFAKPDFTAADGVTTSVPAIGGNGMPFYGTSAAAPHAGALAALALSSNANLTPAQVTAALRNGTVQITQPGPNGRDAGAGILLAPRIFQALAGNGAPVITSATTAAGTVGKPFSYQIVASGSPTSYGVQGLPGGLTVNGSTGAITGTPKAAGKYTLTLNAYNSAGKGSATLTLTVTAAVPVITSSATASGTVGTAFSYQITASGSPTSYGVQGLPGGLTVNANTGAITGTPKAAGKYTLTLNAYNNAGKGSGTLTLTIAAAGPPVITSPTSASGTVGSPFSYQITATNNPTSYGVQGLPGGLSVNASTGLISGTPQRGGGFGLTLNAYNAAGKGSQPLTLDFTVN